MKQSELYNLLEANAFAFAYTFDRYRKEPAEVQSGIAEMVEIIVSNKSLQSERTMALHTLTEALFGGE